MPSIVLVQKGGYVISYCMRNISSALIILIILVITPVLSQADDFRIDKQYISSYWEDSKRMLLSPGSWNATDGIIAGGVVLGTAGLMMLDDEIKESSQKSRTRGFDDASKLAENLGNGAYTLPPLALFYLYGEYADDSRARKTALLGFEGFIISGVATQAIKITAHRHRPSSGESSGHWDGPGIYFENVSFSSGHSASAFSIATVFAGVYEEKIWVAPLAYGLAGAVALSRVNDNEHWASDVFFGSAVGYFTSKALLRYHQSKTIKGVGFKSGEDRRLIYVTFGL